jgi:threonyl-tRNA synthetase
MYSIFGFKFSLGLSTMPDNHLGEKSQWEEAEEALR